MRSALTPASEVHAILQACTSLIENKVVVDLVHCYLLHKNQTLLRDWNKWVVAVSSSLSPPPQQASPSKAEVGIPPCQLMGVTPMQSFCSSHSWGAVAVGKVTSASGCHVCAGNFLKIWGCPWGLQRWRVGPKSIASIGQLISIAWRYLWSWVISRTHSLVGNPSCDAIQVTLKTSLLFQVNWSLEIRCNSRGSPAATRR